jgi:hypothetical protein
VFDNLFGLRPLASSRRTQQNDRPDLASGFYGHPEMAPLLKLASSG